MFTKKIFCLLSLLLGFLLNGQVYAHTSSHLCCDNSATVSSLPENIFNTQPSLKSDASFKTSSLLNQSTKNQFILQDLNKDDYINEQSVRGLDNKTFENLRIYNTSHANSLNSEGSCIISNNLKINNTLSSATLIKSPASSTPYAAARFADTTSSTLTNTTVLVDDAGNLSGITTLTATQITGNLNGTATNTSFVQEQPAETIAETTVLLNSASSANTYNAIVKRDATGNFVTTLITITGVTMHTDNIATKLYVDLLASATLVPKAPATAASIDPVAPLNGAPVTIDGLSITATTTILLLGQTDPRENGLWVVQAGDWIRPINFVSPPQVEKAYVLVLDGNTLGGTSWLCNTPFATIDTDALFFDHYTMSGETTGNNSGHGSAQLFKDKTGNYLHFKSLSPGDHVTVTNNLLPDDSDITLTITGYSNPVPHTLVLRDSSGNFQAATIAATLAGTASENLSKNNGTMTGTLTIPAGTKTEPSLHFISSPHTGLSASADKLSFSTNGVSRMTIDSVGTVTINQFVGSTGVVHNDALGSLSSSLIVDADIAPHAITDSQINPLITPGKVLDFATTATNLTYPNTIVRRDNQGAFEARIITAVSIIGTAVDAVLRNGDSMSGTFTVMAGTPFNPSLQIGGTSLTGLSAETTNTLVMSTNGLNRMYINEVGTVTIPSKLILPAGTEKEPTLQFFKGTNTGISSPKARTLSFDINGIERMSMDATTTSITVLNTAFAIGNVMSLRATQSLNITASGFYPVTIKNTTSLLIIRYVSGITPTVIITMPTAPREGQLFTIKALLQSTVNTNLALTYIPAFDDTLKYEAVTRLNPLSSLASSYNFPYATGGAAVTYIYHTIAKGFPVDGWYRHGRG